MKITIEGTHEEIAALVLAIQERRSGDMTSAIIDELNRRTSKVDGSPLLLV